MYTVMYDMSSPDASFSRSSVAESACDACKSLVLSRSRIVLPTRGRPFGLLVIGEAPGAEEDAAGQGFVGQAGRTLNALLDQHGLVRGVDYGLANIVRCRPEGNRKPSRDEIEHCLPWLARFLTHAQPSVLLLVGATAASVFLGDAPLHWHIDRSRKSSVLLAKDAHPLLGGVIRRLHDASSSGVRAFPMPHTSGMAWHRRAPNKRLWREIGEEQVALAVSALRQS